MTRNTFVGAATGAGALIPALFIVVFKVWRDAPALERLTSQLRLDIVQVFLAPPSFILMADYENDNVMFQAACIVANALLYAAIGLIAWLGWQRSKLWTAAIGGMAAATWGALLLSL